MSVDLAAAIARDPDLPAVEVLLSGAAVDVLTAAVADRGGRVRVARPSQIDLYIGWKASIVYDAVVEWGDHASQETFAALVRADEDVRGTLVEVAGNPVGVWRYPEDPYLHGLEAVVDPRFTSDLVEDLGISAGSIEMVSRSYSPRSRALFEVVSTPVGGRLVFRPGVGLGTPDPETLLYVKVLRRRRAEKVQRVHEALAEHVAVPRCVRHFEDLSAVVLTAVPGETLWSCIRDGVHEPPEPAELLELLDRVAKVEVDTSPRTDSLESVRDNVPTLRAVFPRLAARLERFVERLGEDAQLPLVTIHGDFHEMQVLVGPEGITGLLDLDDMGPGHRVDDMAMMLGRLWSFARTESSGRERIADYTSRLLAECERHADPYEVRRRMAAVAMDHATTAFRFQSHGWRRRTAETIEAAAALLDELLDAR